MLDKILIKEIIAPICIILGAFLINFLIKKIIKKTIKIKGHSFDSKKNKTIVGLINNIIKYFIIIISILMILDVFGIDTKTLIASLGIIGLAVGLSLQDIIKDFLAGLTILFDNQYVVGDVVTIGGFKGEVISLGLKTTKVKAVTGEVKIISNRNIIEVINHSLGNSLIVVDVPFNSNVDIRKVNKLLDKTCNELITELKDTIISIKYLGVIKFNLLTTDFRIIAQTQPHKTADVERIITQKVKEAINDANL